MDLNNLFLGPLFKLEIRYATVLLVVCVCLFYSPGMPILYSMTFGFLFISYWVDKYTFLTICRKPEKLDKKIANLGRKILKYFLIIHLMWSIWIFGSDILFLEPL